MTLVASDLDQDFKLKTKKAKTGTGKKKAKPTKANLITDKKESDKMGFVAFALKKQGEWNDIADLIADLDVDALPLEFVEALVGICGLILKYKKIVLSWKPDKINPPTTPEHFKMLSNAETMVYYLGDIDGLKEAAESMLFVKSFDEQYKPLDKSLNILMSASKEVLDSDRLPKILQYGKSSCWWCFTTHTHSSLFLNLTPFFKCDFLHLNHCQC